MHRRGPVDRRIVIAMGIGLIFSIAACAVVPYTQRKSLILISEREEIGLGETAYSNLQKEVEFSQDSQVTDMVERIGKNIASVSGKENYRWEFKVVQNDSTINAFCLPGGKVVFYTGIIPLCEDEDGVAVVMGHEIAHAIARHGAERLTSQLLAQNRVDRFVKGHKRKRDQLPALRRNLHCHNARRT